MKTLVAYWLACAFLAAGLAACASHVGAPGSFVPGAATMGSAVHPEDAPESEPDAQTCYTRRVQPRWIFQGACSVRSVARKGAAWRLHGYRGYSVVLRVAANDAARGSSVLLADATGSGDVKAFEGKAFPLQSRGFLYLTIATRARTIALRKRTRIELTVTSGAAFAGPCGVAALREGKRQSVWRSLRVTSSLAGTALSYRIPASSYPRIRRGASYLALFCRQAPSPSPSPTTSPTAKPTTSPTASPTPDCSAYTPYAGGYAVYFADDSGQATPSYVYVTDGTHYLNTTGTWKVWNARKSLQPSQYEYRLACFTKTPFHVPQGNSIRVYVSFGPLTVAQLASGSTPAYNLQPSCCEPPGSPAAYQNANYGKLWDYWEYTSNATGLNLDTSQVDAFALPLYVTVTNPAAGDLSSLGPRSYADVVNAFKGSPFWSKLMVYGTGSSSGTLLRIDSPSSATQTYGGVYDQTFNPSFPYDLFYNSSYFGHGYNGQPANGYLAYVEQYFATAAAGQPNYHKIVFVPYQTQYGSGSPACNESAAGLPGGSTVCPTYYASYDANGFEFALTPGSPSTGSSQSFPATVTLPVSYFEQGATGNNIWQPVAASYPGPPSNLVGRVTFNLYKALAIDITRGVATQLGYHPVLPCSSATDCQQSFSPSNGVYGSYNYYQSTNVVSGLPALACGYCLLLHQNFHHGRAYATPYDDYMSQSTDTTSTASSKITVTIEPMSLQNAVRRR